jgi:hypothetical protein
VRKEYDDLDHQQTKFLNSAPDVYLHRKGLPTLTRAIEKNQQRMYEIR